MEEEITVFIVESEEVREKIAKEYLDEGVSYMNILPAKVRKTVVDKLEEVENELYGRNNKTKS